MEIRTLKCIPPEQRERREGCCEMTAADKRERVRDVAAAIENTRLDGALCDGCKYWRGRGLPPKRSA